MLLICTATSPSEQLQCLVFPVPEPRQLVRRCHSSSSPLREERRSCFPGSGSTPFDSFCLWSIRASAPRPGGASLARPALELAPHRRPTHGPFCYEPGEREVRPGENLLSSVPCSPARCLLR